jgi:hypothetical protein
LFCRKMARETCAPAFFVLPRGATPLDWSTVMVLFVRPLWPAFRPRLRGPIAQWPIGGARVARRRRG